MTKINKELLKGACDLMILAALEAEPLYGYEIAKRLKKTSREVFALGEGTLYPILHKLEQQGWLESFWQEVAGRKRKYYGLTTAGKTVLHSKTVEWQQFAKAMQAVIS
ncbi:MAG: PadR family transcriptional regulator [Candidatus Kerfeldbacteria bacterium]|nr:PadR family transcriptional regulator [Candidatus Kerfeldbacteria bacterium]